MNKCGDCIFFNFCERYTTKNETFPETNGCKAFKPKPNREMEKAIKMLFNEYAKAKKQEWVEKPLAYALYQVWKKFDVEANKKWIKKNQLMQNTI